MKAYLFVGLLVLGLAGSRALRAEDEKKPDEAKPAEKKADDAKPAEKKADDAKPAETKTGVLSEKQVNAPDGVAAVLTIKSGGDKQDKKAAKRAARQGGGAPAATEQKFNLLAGGDLATKLADLAKRGATAAVTGVVNLDASTIKVSDVTEQTPTDTGKRKGKGKNK
jgi:hypothetical protein